MSGECECMFFDKEENLEQEEDEYMVFVVLF